MIKYLSKALGLKVSSRKPLPAKVKNKVKEKVEKGKQKKSKSNKK